MSAAVRPTGNPGLTWEQAKQFLDNPLSQLPAEFQLPVWGFWAFFSDILTGQLGLATRINSWIAECDLTLAQLTRAFDAMKKPPNEYKFPSDVLNAIMATVVEQEKQDREREREKREKDILNANTNGERVVTNLAEQFRMQKSSATKGEPWDQWKGGDC